MNGVTTLIKWSSTIRNWPANLTRNWTCQQSIVSAETEVVKLSTSWGLTSFYNHKEWELPYLYPYFPYTIFHLVSKSSLRFPKLSLLDEIYQSWDGTPPPLQFTDMTGKLDYSFNTIKLEIPDLSISLDSDMIIFLNQLSSRFIHLLFNVVLDFFYLSRLQRYWGVKSLGVAS